MPRAVCQRCGADRGDYRAICPACGHRPFDDGLLVAWLLSDAHLDAGQLDAAAARIREGESIKPSDRQISLARRALGRTFSTDPGLDLGARTLLLATSLILTPLPAWVCFVWWLRDRPRAAWQSLGVAIPGSLLYLSLGLWLAARPWLEPLLSRP